MKKVYSFVVRRHVVEEYYVELEATKRPSKLEVIRAAQAPPTHVTVIKQSVINRSTRTC